MRAELLNRRDFLRAGGLVALGLAGCASIDEDEAAEEGMVADESDTSGQDSSQAEVVPKMVTLNSGYEMPAQGLGTYALDFATCVDSIHALAAAGGRLIDTAYMYHNEDAVGEGVRTCGVPRDELFVTTKLYPNQFADPEAAIKEALEKLDIGYIDLLLLHHPGTGDVEAYRAMERAVAAGTVRSIGLSNWYIEELESFLPQVDTMPALVQNEIHPYYQEPDVVPYIQDLGIVVEGWYPLGGRGYNAELLSDPELASIAQAHGVSIPQVILRWNRQRGIVVIPGSSNPDHIAEDLDIHGFSLTEQEMARIAALERAEKHDWY
jgi:diketogulonate reductase-like aldo/keto reductase